MAIRAGKGSPGSSSHGECKVRVRVMKDILVLSEKG